MNKTRLIFYLFLLILFGSRSLVDCAAVFANPSNSFFLVVLVDARHLDYSNNANLVKSLVKHPSDGSKNSDVGHAWIYLEGNLKGQRVFVEGGHSGETGMFRAKYFEGVVNAMEYGDPNPTRNAIQHPKFEPNPVKYLWSNLNDGFFQEGSGGHHPTYAARVDLSEQQFLNILKFIDPDSYNYRTYALTDQQCTTFACLVAALADLDLACEITIQIEPICAVGKDKLRLWKDPAYSTLTFSTPDVLENSLKKAVKEGKMKEATNWYKKTHPFTLKQRWHSVCDSLTHFPERFQRARRLGVI